MKKQNFREEIRQYIFNIDAGILLQTNEEGRRRIGGVIRVAKEIIPLFVFASSCIGLTLPISLN